MSDSASVTDQVLERIGAMSFDAFPPELLAAVRMLLLDGIAVAVAGTQLERAPSILANYLDAQGGRGSASALGLGRQYSAVSAAQLNGASMHVLDFEPIWRPATHALSPALAATLAVAEQEGLGGREVVTALVRGIEIQGWLREAGDSESRDLHFHPPGVVGPIGAAMACGTLLEFDADHMANALGMASSRCGALFSNLGTMTKSTHCGNAAAAGVEAALLTRGGFSANPNVFDTPKQGYLQAFMPGFDTDTFLRCGEHFRILDPGFAIKVYPAKFSTHYGINAALELHSQIADSADISAVAITAADVPSSNRPSPRSGLDGKFSMQYTAAAALLDGHVDLATFTDERLKRADMQAFLPKISITMPPEMPSLYNAGRYADVAVQLKDGSDLSARCYAPRGSWGAESIPADEHLGKVRSCLETCLTADTIDEVIDLGSRVETLDGDELRRLLRLASAA